MSMKAILFLWMVLVESGSRVTATVDQRVVDVINNFQIKLYKELAKSNPNLIFSGYGVTTTLNMLLAGARTTTEDELMDVLGYTAAGLSKWEAQAGYHNILQLQRHHDSAYKLDVTNTVVIHSGKDVLPQYFRILLKEFYTNSTSILDANSILSSLKDEIPNIFDPPVNNSTLDLFSAVLFNAQWVHKFNEGLTAPHPFNNSNTTKDIPFMNTIDIFRYYEDRNFQVLELPYLGHDLQMVIILPITVNGLPDFEKRLNMDRIYSFLRDSRLISVHVQIPRFNSSSSLKLSDVLKDLGMNNSFTPSADLTGIETRRGLYVSDVLQLAAINVTEDGTESPSVSATRVKRQVHFRAQFTADRPFFYAVFHRPSGVVLFLGKMSEA